MIGETKFLLVVQKLKTTLSLNKQFGKFYEDIDSIAPTVKQLNRKNKISFQIKDHETGVKKYDVFVNGKWHLFEYEPKSEIFCSLNSLEIFEKEINIKVVVEDLVGNRKILNKRLTL